MIVLESERPLHSWRHIGWKNAKICIHRASRMEQKCGKCWKSSIFEGKLWVFISCLSEMKIVSSSTLLYSSTFCSLFLPFFVLEIYKFKYDKVFVRHSASISKFEWFEQPCGKIQHNFEMVKQYFESQQTWWLEYHGITHHGIYIYV